MENQAIISKHSVIEIWKDVNGYEGLYQVSNLGQVRSIDRKCNHISVNSGMLGKKRIKGAYKCFYINNRGYKVVDLYKEGKRKAFSIHRLVGASFIINTHNKPEINHIDGDKKNNKVNNLEWNTRQENEQHFFKNTLIDNPLNKSVAKCDKNYEVIEIYKSVAVAAKLNDLWTSNICYACSGKIKKTGGFYWKYI